jgi:CRP-like cAMP-binding protein
LCAATEKAYALYSAGKWDAAEALYQEIAKVYDDPLAHEMVSRCGVHAVARAELFAGLDDAELQLLYGMLTREEFTRGSLIFSEGDEGDRLFVIVKGEVSIKLKVPGTQRSRRLATFGPGMAFGEMALLEGKARSADAYAKRDLSLYTMNPAQLDELRQKHPATAVKIMSNIAHQLATRLRVSGMESIRRNYGD